MSASKAQLSCEQCQRRKIRCDKAVPRCSTCVATDRECTPVQRRRLPRGRNAHLVQAKTASLASRINRLEGVIAQIRQSEQLTSASSGDVVTQQPSPNASSTDNSVVAPDFWSNLVNAIDEVREVFDEDEEVVPNDLEYGAALETGNDMLFGSQLPSRNDQIIGLNSTGLDEEMLLELYRTRFDPMVKVLDLSTAISSINEQPLQGYDDGASRDTRALRAAMLFGASCTILPHEVSNRLETVTRYRSLTERYLHEASFLSNRSLVLLQAFVIYLNALRSTACQANAQQWTLIPLAIRMAEALGMPGSLSAVRGRIWYAIGMLDLQAAFSRGSAPLLTAKDFTVLPDDVPSTFPTLADEWCTSAVMWKAARCQRQLTDASSFDHESASFPDIWSKYQQAIMKDYEQFTEKLCQMCSALGSTATALQRYTVCLARESLLSMRLLLARPMYKTHGQISPGIEINVLQTAVEVLDSAAVKTKPEFELYGWYVWVKWFALAVALAELCGQSRPWDGPARHAWNVVQMEFERHARLVAQTEKGLLWRPIAKLMRKAQSLWQQQVDSQANVLHNAAEQTSTGIAPEIVEWDLFVNDFNLRDELYDFDPEEFLMTDYLPNSNIIEGV